MAAISARLKSCPTKLASDEIRLEKNWRSWWKAALPREFRRCCPKGHRYENGQGFFHACPFVKFEITSRGVRRRHRRRCDCRHHHRRRNHRARPPPPPPLRPRPPPPPPPPSRCGRASFTTILRPLKSFPFSAATALSASPSSPISTKPNPRGWPEKRSRINATESALIPDSLNSAWTSSSLAWKGRFPTYSFFT